MGNSVSWRSVAAVMLATACVGALRYPYLPAQVPLHFGLSGAPDRFVSKSPLVIVAPVLIQLGVTAATALIVSFATRAGGTGPKVPDWVRPIVRATAWVSSTLFIVALKVWGLLPIAGGAWLLLALLPAVIGLGDLVVSGLAVARVQPGSSAPTDRRDPRHWRLGVFYYNPADPELMVPKRFGVGVTVNFAHRAAWTMMAVLLGIPIVIIALLSLAFA